jgi:hypothetical protein
MSLLKIATNQTAYLKAGILGFAGSGKTYTASSIAIGLAKQIGDKKPVAFFDTETGSDFWVNRFKDAGVTLMNTKTRSFSDLLNFMKEAEAACSVAIIDSITHVWQDLMTSYTNKLRRQNGLLFQDWAVIKAEWRQFTDSFLNAKCHTILCGRAGYEYDFETNEAGKKELVKTGTKMKAETEMGYEPSLLLEMETIRSKGLKNKNAINRCTVLKDRTDTINGCQFDFKKENVYDFSKVYEKFKPFIDFLNVGGDHLGIDTTRNSEDLFNSPDYSYANRKKQSEIILEEIQQELVLAGLNGTSTESQKKRTELMVAVFGTSSKTAIESKPLEELKHGFDQIKQKLKKPDLQPVPISQGVAA